MTREPSLRPRCMRVEVAGAGYGLPLEQVQEVLSLRPITRVFHAPVALSGIMNLRGEVLPVLDLAVLLGLEGEVGQGLDARIVVVRELSGAKRRAGVKVDALIGLVEMPEAGLLPLPASIAGDVRSFFLGVIPATPPCSILDVEAVLSAPALSELAGEASA